MSAARQPRLKPLLEDVPPGFLVDSRCLRARGIDRKCIHRYVADGWLERLMRGVYRRPLPGAFAPGGAPGPAPWQSVLLSLQRVMGHDVHLGGASALSANALSAKALETGGDGQAHVYGAVPTWLARLPCDAGFVAHRRWLFGVDRGGIVEAGWRGDGEIAAAMRRWPLRLSCPEQAVLEALDGITGADGFDRLDGLFAGLADMRPELLAQRLAACRSVKVKRLFFVFADRHGHPWRQRLDAAQINLGAGSRALVKGGRLHPAYLIQVPQKFATNRSETASL